MRGLYLYDGDTITVRDGGHIHYRWTEGDPFVYVTGGEHNILRIDRASSEDQGPPTKDVP